MTREGQIKEAAFIKGTTWADEDPVAKVGGVLENYERGYKEAIEKACEWLVTNVWLYASLEFLPDSDYPQGTVEIESLLKAFKQAMKGGEE